MQKVAFIGCGRIADHIAQFFDETMEGVQVLQVCDVVEEKANRIAEQVGAEAVFDMEEVLGNPEITTVIILTESGKHGQHAKQALEAGKNVIVEKPIGLIPSEVIENQRIAQEKGLMYTAIKQNRFNPAIRNLKEAHDSGRFGKLILASIRLIWCRYQEYYEDGWHGTWAMDGGVISQQAIHHVDALQWICGSIEEVVSAQGNMINHLEAEDTTVALLKFKNGALGTIEVTTAARPEDKEASISIVGEKGLAEIGGIALNKTNLWQFKKTDPDDENVLEKYSQDVPSGYGLSHGPFLKELFHRLNKGVTKPLVSAEDALASVYAVHAIYKSAEEKAWISVGEESISKRLGQQEE